MSAELCPRVVSRLVVAVIVPKCNTFNFKSNYMYLIVSSCNYYYQYIYKWIKRYFIVCSSCTPYLLSTEALLFCERAAACAAQCGTRAAGLFISPLAICIIPSYLRYSSEQNLSLL